METKGRPTKFEAGQTMTLPQIYTCTMSTKEAAARTRVATKIAGVKFFNLGHSEDGNKVTGQTHVSNVKDLDEFNRRLGILLKIA